MHNFIKNSIFIYVQSIDYLLTKKRLKICSICGNMDYLYV
jgi:hypothetical protein